MEILADIHDLVAPFLKNIWLQMGLLIAFATIHGYGGAWLAVRMLFRPRHPVKFFGITIFPQGMIPRHRERLANAIGKAVGNELITSDTIHEHLIAKDLLRTKLRAVVDSYLNGLLSEDQPSLIEMLPASLRTPLLEMVAALQYKLADHIRTVISSEGSTAAIGRFVTHRVDEFLGKRIAEVVDDGSFADLIRFIDGRLRSGVNSKIFEDSVRDLISRRLDGLLTSDTPIGTMFTPDAVALLKEKAGEQIEPAIRQITDLAAAERTRSQISALIKHEVHDYYENLSFFKKIFVSRENLLDEVDELVNESFPRRIEETLRTASFAEEARAFIDTTIDNALEKPLPVIIGTLDPQQLSRLKEQITMAVLSLLRNEETVTGVSRYINGVIEKLRPHSIDAVLQIAHPNAEAKLKQMLARGLIDVLGRDDTLNAINELIGLQIERMLAAPLGKLGELMPEEKLRALSESLTDAMIAVTAARLPDAIRDFDVGGMVREKIRGYPPEKLESLVMSVAREHLRTIEAFGALFGFLIGLVQAVQFYFYAH